MRSVPVADSVTLPEQCGHVGAAITDDTAYLEPLTYAGARARWGEDLDYKVVERLAFELKVIAAMGFSSYFLLVWDLRNIAAFAREF